MSDAQIRDTVDLIFHIAIGVEQHIGKEKADNFFSKAMDMLAAIVGGREKVIKAVIPLFAIVQLN